LSNWSLSVKLGASSRSPTPGHFGLIKGRFGARERGGGHESAGIDDHRRGEGGHDGAVLLVNSRGSLRSSEGRHATTATRTTPAPLGQEGVEIGRESSKERRIFRGQPEERQPATKAHTANATLLLREPESAAQVASHRTTTTLNPRHRSGYGADFSRQPRQPVGWAILVMYDVIAVSALVLPPCQNSVDGNSCNSARRPRSRR